MDAQESAPQGENEEPRREAGPGQGVNVAIATVSFGALV